jgi:hypothetical protein
MEGEGVTPANPNSRAVKWAYRCDLVEFDFAPCSRLGVPVSVWYDLLLGVMELNPKLKEEIRLLLEEVTATRN